MSTPDICWNKKQIYKTPTTPTQDLTFLDEEKYFVFKSDRINNSCLTECCILSTTSITEIFIHWPIGLHTYKLWKIRFQLI